MVDVTKCKRQEGLVHTTGSVLLSWNG